MKRYTQTEDGILERIGEIEVDWREAHFEAFRELLNSVPQKESYDCSDIERLLDQDFDAAWTAARMIWTCPKTAS